MSADARSRKIGSLIYITILYRITEWISLGIGVIRRLQTTLIIDAHIPERTGIWRNVAVGVGPGATAWNWYYISTSVIARVYNRNKRRTWYIRSQTTITATTVPLAWRTGCVFGLATLGTAATAGLSLLGGREPIDEPIDDCVPCD